MSEEPQMAFSLDALSRSFAVYDPVAECSYLYSRPQFDHEIVGESKEVSNVASIAGHHGKQAFAPMRHAGAACRDHDLSAEEVRDRRFIHLEPFVHAKAQRTRHVGLILEAVVHLHPPESVDQGLHLQAIFFWHPWHILKAHGEDHVLLM